jgi:hypothetical protein
MTSLRQAWATLEPRLKILRPLRFSSDQWSVVERIHAAFNDREAHTHLPMPIALFRDDARRAIHRQSMRLDDVRTVYVDSGRHPETHVPETHVDEPAGALARYACLFNDDVDAMMAVLVPAARYRKGHYAYGRFTVPQPHGLHTDHSAEDPDGGAEPICIARIETLGTHYVAGDYKAYDDRTQSMFRALRYWIAVPEGQPDAILEDLLDRGTLSTIPVNHVMLMVAGNGTESAQVTQHIAARPPEGGLHSAFFQRQYRLA